MSEPRSVAIIVGSLRAGSLSRKLAHALTAQAPPSLACRIVEIGDLPLYNEDLDGDPPASWTRFRGEIRDADAILFVTPEYNRSMPACLKNAVDVGSRPPGKSVFDGMPAGVVSQTPYKLGAFGANHALRQTFVFLNMPVMQQPEAYVGGAAELFADDGALKSDDTAAFLSKFMSAFAAWIDTVRAHANASAFNAFMPTREAAARAYVNGDPAPLAAITTGEDPATFFSPRGDHLQGAADIAARYAKDAAAFSRPGSSRLEVLQSAASGDLAFWSGLQQAEVHFGGHAGVVAMSLRITEVFRFEAGGWKLVHRHADQAGDHGG